MIRWMSPENSRNKRWCAALVILAVCALAVSVATRYSVSYAATSALTSVHSHSLSEPVRQRLIKSAAAWAPVEVCHAVLEAPSSYSRVAPAAPVLPGTLFERSLYNRPPPSLFLA